MNAPRRVALAGGAIAAAMVVASLLPRRRLVWGSPSGDLELWPAAADAWNAMRAESLAAATGLDEKIKWGHLVYFSVGPTFLIRAEDDRVLFGFWRGKRLRNIEPRLKPGGKYEMATLVLDASTSIAPQTARALVEEAVALNRKLGDPTMTSRPMP